MLDTRPLLLASDFPALRRRRVSVLQVNLGYTCNLSCTHCHVNAGPRRTEQMDRATIDLVLQCLEHRKIMALDLTGGAPELNPHFRDLVSAARKLGVSVTDRCNLTILGEPGQEDLAEFLAAHQVTVTASLPCYLETNVEQQRGKHVYWKSIAGLKVLNALGYGTDPALVLNLVFNPGGPRLPPPQPALEADYKRELGQRHGIVFNQLFTLTNMPISRFGSMLLSKGLYVPYMQTLRDAYNPATLDSVMCRDLISVDYQGYLFDCDFNQMLKMPMPRADRGPAHLRDLLTQDFVDAPIAVGDHCYGCTAGAGSSCGGALA